jgi:hypothetical protein
MTGKAYYLTTFGAWQRHAARLTNSHWLALHPGALSSPAVDNAVISTRIESDGASLEVRESTMCGARPDSDFAVIDDTTVIIALVEADEGAHLMLQDNPDFELLPHPLAQRSISVLAQNALAKHGVAPGATTFEAAEAIARVHPLLQHRIF